MTHMDIHGAPAVSTEVITHVAFAGPATAAWHPRHPLKQVL